jgi:hypothetical protein
MDERLLHETNEQELPELGQNWWESHLRGFEAQMPRALMRDLRPLFNKVVPILKDPDQPMDILN